MYYRQICNKKAIETIRFIFYLKCIFLLTPLEKNPRAATVIKHFTFDKNFLSELCP